MENAVVNLSKIILNILGLKKYCFKQPKIKVNKKTYNSHDVFTEAYDNFYSPRKKMKKEIMTKLKYLKKEAEGVNSFEGILNIVNKNQKLTRELKDMEKRGHFTKREVNRSNKRKIDMSYCTSKEFIEMKKSQKRNCSL